MKEARFKRLNIKLFHLHGFFGKCQNYRDRKQINDFQELKVKGGVYYKWAQENFEGSCNCSIFIHPNGMCFYT